ncbi:hypothetical protein AKJ16_DCAP01426 [Drosera capensis]
MTVEKIVAEPDANGVDQKGFQIAEAHITDNVTIRGNTPTPSMISQIVEGYTDDSRSESPTTRLRVVFKRCMYILYT